MALLEEGRFCHTGHNTA